MELFKEAFGRLEKSKEFKDWKKKNKDCYLTSGFVIVEKEQGPWKAGYYDEKKNNVTSFIIDKEISIEPAEEIFQKKKVKIKKLDVKKVLVDLPQAIVVASNLQQEEYKEDSPLKIIAILQNMSLGQVWNLVFITQKFNTLNIKIDTKEGKVLEHKIASIMSFKKE